MHVLSRPFRLPVVLATLLFAATATPGQEPTPLDLVLEGGRVLDGTGNPWFRADVGVRGGRIVALGDLTGRSRTETLDVSGKVVAPGFIDMHSHADGPRGHEDGLRAEHPLRRAAHNLVAQGITTVVVNQDGRSPASIAAQRRQLEDQGHGPNAILMVGHNTIRAAALGDDAQRTATAAEVEAMKEALARGVREGAYGLSAGLEYVPGRWSDTAEVKALVGVLAETGGVYIVHERASGSDPMWFVPSRDPAGPPTMLQNIAEVIEVARDTGVPTVATHIKIRGADYWGSGGGIVQRVERAREQGIEVWLDQYPYDSTGSDGNTVLLPRWALAPEGEDSEGEDDETPPDYAARLGARLATPALREAIARDVAREIERRGGAERIVVMQHPNTDLVGRSLFELAGGSDAPPNQEALFQAAVNLQLEGDRTRPGGARLRGFSLSEIDIEPLGAKPYTITASDAGIALEEDGPVHARFYGTFPRKIRHYAMDRGILSVPAAVRSSTSLPAQVLRLTDRGQVREGFVADLVVLDLEQLRDTATFFEPHQYPEGVDHVFVAGVAVVERGQVTEELPGKVLSLRESRFATR